MTTNKFEPISLATLIRDEIHPETPGFVEKVIQNTYNQEDYKVYSTDQVEAIKKESWQEGYSSANSEIDRENQRVQELHRELLKNLAIKFEEIIPQIGVMNNQIATVLTQVALKAVKKIAGDFLASGTELIVKDTIEKALAIITQEPSITIFVNPKLENPIRENIASLKSKANFKGEINIKADEHLHEINCVIEWQDGMIENNHEHMWDQIEKILQSESSNETKKNNE